MSWLRKAPGGRRFRRFGDAEDGAATIEAVLWMPMFFFFFITVVDVSLVFHRQAELYRVVQDANRALSVGRLESIEATETFIKTNIAHMSELAEVTTEIGSDGVIRTSLLVPVAELDATGVMSWLNGYRIEVASEFFLEY